MTQLSLFESADSVLVDDERGRIIYTAQFVDGRTADAWFRELRTAVSWRSERRMMYERELDVPRLMASFALDVPDASMPGAIRTAALRVIERLDVPFNSVGLNLYRDGRDSVAPHNDHLDEIRKGFPIALLSLGAVRRMTIRAKEAPKRSVQIDLAAGSLLVMDYTTQLHYTHAVPKTGDAVGERISLAFRVKRRTRPTSTAGAGRVDLT
jgi:alkylated DNA repair dioxygenase AlkB